MIDLLYKAQTRWMFHSHIKIKIPVYCDDALFDHYYSIYKEVDRLYNSYETDSFIDKINKNAGRDVEVDEETVQLISRVVRLSEYFSGAFDITIMPLIRLWGFYKNDEIKIPTIDEINRTLTLVNYKKICCRQTSVRIDEGQEIITGSFIKAYATDKVIVGLKQQGISDALINAGGSTIFALNDATHPAWQIQVRHPENKTALFTLNLSNKCYSTSAQNNTFVEIDNKKYGHILNPKTGYPSSNKLIGIISESAFLGDIASTGLFNCDGATFSDTIEELRQEDPDLEGFLLDTDNNLFFSKGFEHYIDQDTF